MLWTHALGVSISQVVFSPDDKSIAACSDDGNITIFDSKTGVVGLRLQGHTAAVWTIAFSPDGKRLASGHADPLC